MFHITKCEIKTKDWKVISVVTADGDSIENVSVNRTNKKGEVFPNFDAIMTNSDVSGQLWNSPAGKQYLFAPKANSSVRRDDMGPASSDAASAELKNILILKVIPLLEQNNAAAQKIEYLIGALGDRIAYLISGQKKEINPDDVPFN